MSSPSNEFPERRRVSKVTFSPISSDLLIVRIRKVSCEVKEEDIPKMSSAPQAINRNPDDQNESANHSKSAMTDIQKTTSISSQTTQKEPIDLISETESSNDSTPCLKHAAENISRKASDIPTEKISMCNNCSKSMLSYIFLVQDFLDSLAKEISGTETSHCLQCARQEVRKSIANSVVREDVLPNKESISRTHSEYASIQNRTESKQKDVSRDRSSSKRTSRAKSNQESRRNEDHQKGLINPPTERDKTQWKQQKQQQQQQQKPQQRGRQQTDFIYNVSPPLNAVHEMQNIPTVGGEKRIIIEQPSSENRNNQQETSPDHQSSNQPWTPTANQNIKEQVVDIHLDRSGSQRKIPVSGDEIIPQSSVSSSTQYFSPYQQTNEQPTQCFSPYQQTNEQPTQYFPPYQQIKEQTTDKPIFRAPLERVQPNYDTVVPHNTGEPSQNEPNVPVQSPVLYRDDVDGIVSTLSNAEREIYDSARNRAGWESLTETQERLGLPPGNLVTSEAFVTSCRNNAEAIGCLVVGTSLLLCRTSRTLCVLVSDGVSTAFRGALSSVFQVVQYVRALDSLGTTKLSLLEQPELGISFDKLNIWRLVQFTKCVYLNPDTVVIQNCDELFCRDELSAVPDIGWPDCFNSGVFVYSPSIETFWQLLEFVEKQGSYDGGDQGLLNSYFNSWSSDISKKLSFIYNLMANVSYTYTPAFRQFGRDVKIVQFHGSFKPWHVKFYTNTGQIAPSSPVHPTYVQFVHIWINIFRISVLRLLSQEIQSYAASQEAICAVETLRFFPLPSESEAEFFLTPPSVRLRLTEKKLRKSTSLPISEARRRKSAEFMRYVSTDDDVIPETSTSSKEKDSKTESYASAFAEEKGKESVSDEVFQEGKVTEKEEVKDENAIPGSEVGDYHGMKAWEQGRMDYQGADSSDNIMKRLEYLMSKPK